MLRIRLHGLQVFSLWPFFTTSVHTSYFQVLGGWTARDAFYCKLKKHRLLTMFLVEHDNLRLALLYRLEIFERTTSVARFTDVTLSSEVAKAGLWLS